MVDRQGLYFPRDIESELFHFMCEYSDGIIEACGLYNPQTTNESFSQRAIHPHVCQQPGVDSLTRPKYRATSNNTK